MEQNIIDINTGTLEVSNGVYERNKEYMIQLAHDYAAELALLVDKYDSKLKPLFGLLISISENKYGLPVDRVYNLILSDRNPGNTNGVVYLK